MRLLFAVECLAAIAIANIALADETRLWNKISHWKITSGSNNCMAIDQYKNGVVFGFIVDDDGNFKLTFSKEEWNIPFGRYNISLSVDKAPLYAIKSYGSKEMVISFLPIDDNTINIIRSGKVLYASLGRQKYGFSLVGTRNMIPELFRCASAHYGAINPFARSENPFSGVQDRQGVPGSGDRVIPSPNPFD